MVYFCCILMILDMIYNNFVSKLAEKFERRFSEISVHYNFDNGDEFEIALCESKITKPPLFI